MRNLSSKSVSLIAILALAVPLAGAGQAPKPEEVSGKVVPSVVSLKVGRADGSAFIASGFLGLKDGVIVTALSPLHGALKATATFANGEEFDCPGLLDKDERRNLALLKIKSFGRPMLAVTAGELAVNDKVFCAAVKDGAFGLVEAGVAEIMIKGGIKFYRLNATIPPGNGGAPVVSARGEVVGVHMTIVENDEQIEVAVPSAYVLALEPSLPVQPWAGAAGTPAREGVAPSGANASLDEALATGMAHVHDKYIIHEDLSASLYKITRYGQYPVKYLYQAQTDLDNAASQLSLERTNDPLRAKLVQAVGQLLAKEKNALELEITCATLNKDTPPDKAVPQAEAAASRANALLASVPAQVQGLWPDFKRLGEASPEFLKALSSEMRYFLGLAERKSQLGLGAQVAAKNPFYLVRLQDKALAWKLGLRPGDTIVSVGDRTFSPDGDIEDFKLLIEAGPGATLGLTVLRGGKNKALQAKVPPDVLGKYPRSVVGFPWL